MFCIQCWIDKTAQMIQNLVWLFGEVSPNASSLKILNMGFTSSVVRWNSVCVCNNGRLNILSVSWRRSLQTHVDTGSERSRGIMSRGNICALLLKLGQSGSWSCWASGAESRCSVCPRWTRMGGWTQASSAEAPMTLGDSFQWKLQNKQTHTIVNWLRSNWSVTPVTPHSSGCEQSSLPPVRLKELLGPKAENELAGW